MSRILVVGGTGLTGAHAALYLRRQGHDVTIMSRSATTLDCLKKYDHIAVNYVPAEMLVQFEQMVFAAGADIRQFPPGAEEVEFYTRVNSEGIPAYSAAPGMRESQRRCT